MAETEKKKKGKGCLIVLGLIGFFVFIIFVNAMIDKGRKVKKEGTTRQQPTVISEEESTEERIEIEEEIEPFKLSGVGQQATEKFTLNKGLAIFKMTHNGKRHFAIWLMNNDGEKVDLLVNTTGLFDGSKAVKIPRDGTYLLDIAADGSWAVEIE